MKVTSSETNEDHYDPHSITITFESAKEAQGVYCLFNHAKLVDFLYDCGINSVDIKKAIEADAPYNHVDYKKIWERFVNLLKD